eukprot:CAMPEP_0117661008 /NCGR_PEP_ID=MMETSP0804-20121206/7308_1 /TAXON_ID=1074897 /ORGANISM="Tetraselmis astigmatica, Strain CCMP880" /LENGTH=163 /DNA_ID=CAMNT_0005467847 /DNA_START=567 /DNA_END=1055 /DNA_ORIENTATION=+
MDPPLVDHSSPASTASGMEGGVPGAAEDVSFSDLTKLIVRGGLSIFTRSRAEFLAALQSFVTANAVPSSSPNYLSPDPDRIEVVLKLLTEPALDRDEEVCHALLQVVKVLSRKQTNRVRVGQIGIRAVLSRLEMPLSARIAAEGANVLLNICYERDHVISVLR